MITSPNPDGGSDDAGEMTSPIVKPADGGSTIEALADGARCSRGDQCHSGYCDGARCCQTGLCCNMRDDCPSAGPRTAVCEDASNCQGRAGALDCIEHRCVTRDGVADDSACGATVQASSCGLYAAVHCSGLAVQEPPPCPTSCDQDSDCDAQAHCSAAVCILDKVDGSACNRNASCMSEHCQAGICCAGSDCCSSASDCPPSYATPPQCDDPGSCQGTHGEVACTDFICNTTRVADDSACDRGTLARVCGAYDVFCRGAPDQTAPAVCASTTCSSDAQCERGLYCTNLACMPDRVDGESCSRNAQCEGGHCSNGYCCRAGSCCASDDDCGDRYLCTEPRGCQGVVYRSTCSAAFQCEDRESAPSSYGCFGRRARSCQPYRDVLCPFLPVAPQVAECAGNCARDSECSDGWRCDAGSCVLLE